MGIAKRALAAALCLTLLLGYSPALETGQRSLAAGTEGWTLSFDEAAYGNGRLLVELYSAKKQLAPEIEWTAGEGMIRAVQTAGELFAAGGDWYAVVQYDTGSAAQSGETDPSGYGTSGLTDEEIEQEFALYLAALGVSGGENDMPYPPASSYSDRESALAWYAQAVTDETFCDYCLEECIELPTAEALAAEIEDWYDPDDEDYDQTEVDEEIICTVMEYAWYYRNCYGVEDDGSDYSSWTIDQKRWMIEYLIQYPVNAPEGYTPPPASGGGYGLAESVSRVAVVKLTAEQLRAGLSIGADFFDSCVPLAVTTPTVGAYAGLGDDYGYGDYYGAQRAEAEAFFLTGDQAIPAHIDPPEEGYDYGDYGVLPADSAGEYASEALTGTVPQGDTQYLVLPGEYLVSTSVNAGAGGDYAPALVDWETVKVRESTGGSADFTRGRSYVELSVNYTPMEGYTLQNLSLFLSGGDLKTASVGADLCAVDYGDILGGGSFDPEDYGSYMPAMRLCGLKAKAGNYGTATFSLGEQAADSADYPQAAWCLESMGEIREDRSITLPTLLSQLQAELIILKEDGAAGPFEAGEALAGQVMLTSGAFRLLEAGLVRQTGAYSVQALPLKTRLALEDGTLLTPEGGAAGLNLRFTAPASSQTVTAQVSIPGQTVLPISVRTSAYLPVGAEGDTTPPAAPTGFSAQAGAEGLSFAWSGNTEGDLEGYRLYLLNTEGSARMRVGSFGKSAVSGSIPFDDTWESPPWSFALTALDRYGNESEQSTAVRVSPLFYGTGEVSAAAGSLEEGSFTLPEDNSGSLGLAFLVGTDTAPENRPAQVNATLEYRDLNDQKKAVSVTLSAAAGYTAELPITADMAVLEKAVFSASGRTLDTRDLGNRSVVAHLRLLAPDAADYALSASFDGAGIGSGLMGYRVAALEGTDGVFTGLLGRDRYRMADAFFRIGEEYFPVSGSLLSCRTEGDTFTIPASALPEKIRLRVELNCPQAQTYLSAWFEAWGMPEEDGEYDPEDGDLPMNAVLASVGYNPSDPTVFYISNPGNGGDTLFLELTTAEEDLELSYTDMDTLRREGMKLVPGADVELTGTVRVKGLDEYMYMDVLCGEYGDQPLAADLPLLLTDEGGESTQAVWHWVTHQLEAADLTPGARYRVALGEDLDSFLPLDRDGNALVITALRDGSNREAPPVLVLEETAQVGLEVLFRSDPATDPEGGVTGSVVCPEELAVYYFDTLLKDWTVLPGTQYRFGMTDHSYAVGGIGIEFVSDPISRKRLDTEKGLRLIPGSQGRYSNSIGVNEILHTGVYEQGDVTRFLSGQVFDTVGRLTMHTEINSSRNYDEWYLQQSTLEVYFGDESESRGALPGVVEGLKLADTPRLELRFTHAAGSGSLIVLLRNTESGQVTRYDCAGDFTRSGEISKYIFNGLDYGTYDLLLFMGSGAVQSGLERRFRDGEAIGTLTVPRTVSGFVGGPYVLTESNACIALDQPAAPIDLETAGIQSVTVNCDQDSALAGDRVTFTVRFTCVPGGSEAMRTLLLDTENSLLEVDSVVCSLTAADGSRVTGAVAPDRSKLTVPESGQVLTGILVVSGRMGDGAGASHASLHAEVHDPDSFYREYWYARCQREDFRAYIPERTATDSVILSGRFAQGRELTLQVTSVKHPDRAAEQTVTVSQYGYWKLRLYLPGAGEEQDTYEAVILYNGEELTRGSIAYAPTRILPSMIRLSYRGEESVSEITAYPGSERDFAELNRAVLVMAAIGSIQVEIAFDDDDPDAWGLTDARRVMEPTLALRYDENAEPLYFDFYALDQRTYTYDNPDLGLRAEGVPYSTRYRAAYPAIYYGRMTLEYGLLPVKGDGSLPEPAEAMPFTGSAEQGEAIRGLGDFLGEPYTYEGSYSCQRTNSSFSGVLTAGILGAARPSDLSADTVLIGPYSGQTVEYRLEETVTIEPLGEDQLSSFGAAGEALSSRYYTGEDSFCRYADVEVEYYLKPEWNEDTEQITLWLGVEVTRHTVMDTAKAAEDAALASLMVGPGGSTLFGVSESTNDLIGGWMLDASTEGLKTIAKEGGKLAAQNADLATAIRGVSDGLGNAANVVGIGLTVYDDVQAIEKSQTELSKLRKEIYELVGKDFRYYAGKLTCEEGGAARVKQELWDIYSGVWDKLTAAMEDSETARTAEGLFDVGVACTGFIPVPGAGTAIGYIHGLNKDLTEENLKYAETAAMWKICYQAEAEMRKAFASYDPSKCEEEKEPDAADLNVTTTDDLLARREQYKKLGSGSVSLDFHPRRILDPSGIVYEGMLSNPLEGVTVTIEYLDGDTWKPWAEAPEYNDQETRYVTGPNGYYKWDVPDGLWRVRYEKEGYNGGEPVYSDAMEVPPIWLDVNQNLTNPGEYTAKAAAGETGVTLRFTKPVLAEDLSGVSLLRDGQPTDAVFQPLLEESGLARDVFAACVPDPNAVYTVRVSGVRSYAGTACTFTVPVDVSGIDDPTRCKGVTADRESGTTVASGQTLALGCDTEGAVIWYTLDGSCPCVEENPARKPYTGPITLTEDTFVIAYAQAEGREDSATRAFIYFCAAPGESVLGRVSVEAHAVTVAVWVDLREADGACDVLLAYYQSGRFLGLCAERGIDASAQESISLAKRFTCAETLDSVAVKVFVLRSGSWQPLLPAKTIYP